MSISMGAITASTAKREANEEVNRLRALKSASGMTPQEDQVSIGP